MAPTTLRSASISSSSTASSKVSSDGIKKKFSCSHPSCGKSFSRSEHLHRHALNHKDGNNTCLRCSAHFRRRDLLDRHMSRHKEKDDEAGGEGLGVLATRKRLWRDTDGKIVNARRPSYTQESGNKRRMISKSSERKDSKASEYERRMSSTQQILTALPPSPASMSRVDSARSSIVVDTSRPQLYSKPESHLHSEEDEAHRRPWYQHGSALPSPATSSSSYSDHDSSLQSESQSPNEELDTLYEDAWPIHAPALPEIINHSPIRDSGYPANPGWGPQPSFQTFMGASGEFEDAPPIKDTFGSGMGLYGWQNPWSVGSQMMLSRCREEKYESAERGLDYPHQEVLRRGFGLGSC